MYIIQHMFNSHSSQSLCRIQVTVTSAMGIMKRTNIVPRVGIEYKSLAFQTSVITITPPWLPDVATLLMPPWLLA